MVFHDEFITWVVQVDTVIQICRSEAHRYLQKPFTPKIPTVETPLHVDAVNFKYIFREFLHHLLFPITQTRHSPQLWTQRMRKGLKETTERSTKYELARSRSTVSQSFGMECMCFCWLFQSPHSGVSIRTRSELEIFLPFTPTTRF